MHFWIFLTNAIIAISAEDTFGSALRNKRQMSFGFGLPNVQDTQAIGGLVNSFLGGFFGQNQHHGARPFEGGHGGDHGHFPNGNNEGCNKDNGGCHHGCRFGRGRPNCFCNIGYFLNEDKRTCSDIDECSNQFNRPCQDICTNTEGSFVCGCSNGGIILPDGSCGSGQFGITCEQNNGGCQQYCRDRRRRGGVRCRCDDGYEIGPDGRSCLDIDECASGFHNCGPLPCVNKVGSYDCGSTSHTVAPVPVDPCQINNGGCQHVCINNHGTILCQCPAEFQLVNGKLCQRVVVLPENQPTTIIFSTSSPLVVLPVTTAPPLTAAPPPVVTTALLPQQKDCGSNNKKSLFRRIVGGKPSDPKDWPWMAALLRGTENQQFCGGTLISNRHVLTAAHCVITFTSNNIRVRLGEYSFATSTENSPTDFKVAEIRKHERYDTTTQENDIAILKLESPATFGEFISPACLPPPNNNFEDLPGYVIGWGTIYFGGPVSNVLQEVVIPAWKQDECVKAYPNNKVTDGMMCCGQKGGGKDSCQGDSGGPFLIQIFPDIRWYIAGVVSWGIECASPDRPGVYTRVNKYLDWIGSNTV